MTKMICVRRVDDVVDDVSGGGGGGGLVSPGVPVSPANPGVARTMQSTIALRIDREFIC